MDNTYHIGAIAKLLGISPESIRLYERNGILKGHRNCSGAYRTYNHQDITALMRARSYHNCGFSTHMICQLLNSNSIDEITAAYKKKRDEVENEIGYLQSVSVYLQESLKLLNGLDELTDRFTLCMRPEMYRMPFMEDDDLSIDQEAYQEFHRWMSLLPITFPAQKNDWMKLKSGSFSSQSALGIFKKDADRFHIRENNFVEFLPSVRCLYTVIRVEVDMPSPRAAFLSLIQEVATRRLMVTGDIVSRTFLSMDKSFDYCRYRQVWLPVSDRENT